MPYCLACGDYDVKVAYILHLCACMLNAVAILLTHCCSLLLIRLARVVQQYAVAMSPCVAPVCSVAGLPDDNAHKTVISTSLCLVWCVCHVSGAELWLMGVLGGYNTLI